MRATEACSSDERARQADCVAPCLCYAAVGRAGVRAEEMRGAEICIQTHTAVCLMRKATALGTSDWSEASTQPSLTNSPHTPPSSRSCVELDKSPVAKATEKVM